MNVSKKNNNDGFDIAEKDLYLRGAGDFFGTNQSGVPTWKFFRPYLDLNLIECFPVFSILSIHPFIFLLLLFFSFLTIKL